VPEKEPNRLLFSMILSISNTSATFPSDSVSKRANGKTAGLILAAAPLIVLSETGGFPQ